MKWHPPESLSTARCGFTHIAENRELHISRRSGDTPPVNDGLRASPSIEILELRQSGRNSILPEPRISNSAFISAPTSSAAGTVAVRLLASISQSTVRPPIFSGVRLEMFAVLTMMVTVASPGMEARLSPRYLLSIFT